MIGLTTPINYWAFKTHSRAREEIVIRFVPYNLKIKYKVAFGTKRQLFEIS
jgi:hypothetical protein